MNRIAQLEEFLRESPDDVFLHYALTMEYVKLEDNENARIGFDNLITSYPDYVGTYYHFGKFLEKNSEKILAEEIYKKGIIVANQARKMHAMSELQGALNMLIGYDDDEDDF